MPITGSVIRSEPGIFRISRLNNLKCEIGGKYPVCIAFSTSSRDAAPAAASQCPYRVFDALNKSFSSSDEGEKTVSTEATSMGSPNLS